MALDAFRFDGKRAVVVGAATGMGRATAELLLALGADVVALDHAAVGLAGTTEISVDLRDPETIASAVDLCGGPVHALLCCAGAADGTDQIEKVNFIGHRHLIDLMFNAGRLPAGAAIGMISSAAGLGWEANLGTISEFLDTSDFESAAAWMDAHPDCKTYMFTKQAMSTYVARECVRLRRAGIRINAICPGPTDTPLASDNADQWLAFGQDFRVATGQETSTPEEQAHPLVFLCSDAASYVNGITLVTDGGYFGAGLSGAFTPATGIVHFLLGRSG